MFLDSNDVRKSNVISITTPLETPVNGPINDQYFPYITTNNEPTPSDARLESRFTVLYTIQKCLSVFKIINISCYPFRYITGCEF